MIHEFSRTEMLIGEVGLEKLRNSKVIVFGIGGVGTYVVEGLARSGVGHLILVDNDDISLTNINRQIHATHKTIGQSKVETMKSRVLDINPNAKVDIFHEIYNAETALEILPDHCDYVVDAIDMVTSKLDLIQRCKNRGFRIISSMGTGNKLDPTMLEIADIKKTSVCPLARVMRKELKSRDIKNLKVVYSKEQPMIPIMTKGVEAEDTGIRRGVPGSISFVPSVAGLIIASEVVKDLLNE